MLDFVGTSEELSFASSGSLSVTGGCEPFSPPEPPPPLLQKMIHGMWNDGNPGNLNRVFV